MKSLVCACVVASFAATAHAGGGLLGMDHMLARSDSGIYSRSNQLAAMDLSILAVVAGSLYEGNESRLGRTFWQATDSMLLTGVTAAGAKRVFRRQRPIDGNNPDNWFASRGDASFPSGEVAHMAAVVTPFILEYRETNPAVWGLAALPLYVGIGRAKSQAHWQSDILAGAVLGGTVGYLVHAHNPGFTASVLPHGVSIGYHTSF
jgi:undecaprenyl-diphosphatase